MRCSYPAKFYLCFLAMQLTVLQGRHAALAQKGGAKVETKMDYGEPGPQWLRESETYAIGFNPGEWAALAASKVKFITHCPINKEFFERCHTLGIRCFPYVTFYQGFATQTYMGVNLKDHPNYIEVDEQGNLKRTGFWESEDAKNMYTTCPNVKEYQDAMVAWVKKIMDLGADGVFVDNIGHRVPCFGPKFGKHKHLYDDPDHAFSMLLKRTRELIKSYNRDGALIVNSASPLSIPAEYWKYIDADMLESYICTWASKERWFDWKTHWHEQGVKLQPYLKAGKQVQALSYLGSTPYGVREDAFFCYATARLAGFVWTSGSTGDPDVAPLHQLRLGKPLSDEVEENGIYYRPFEAGLVAVNPDKVKKGFITLKPPIPTSRFFDFFDNRVDKWPFPGADGYEADLAEKHGGTRAIKCVNSTPSMDTGAFQYVVLNQEKPTPIVASGWSKALDVKGDVDPNYAIYLDIDYNDGTYLCGQTAQFTRGTHDWEFKSVTVKPEKPIKGLGYNALFRYNTGTAWFDDLSLKVLDDPNAPREVLQNGGFEETGRQGKTVDVSKTGKLEIPAYSGRVFLYAPDTKEALAKPGPTLTIVTQPGLGEVRFRVDGFDYWTCSGRWTTEYVLGTEFGRFGITFDNPGRHTIEVVDVVPADMKTAAGYGSGERLGQFMDPSNPTKPSGKKKFRFREWTGLAQSKDAKIEVDVKENTTLTAEFDVEEKG